MTKSQSALTPHHSLLPVWVVRQVPHEGLGTIADALSRCRIAWTTIDAFAGALPQFDPNAVAGLVVLGGPMNVDQVDRFPFLAEEVRWLQQAVDANLPVLGVCLGSQLLAKALGRPVYPNRIKEIGWYDVELFPAAATDPLFQDLPLPLGDAPGEGAGMCELHDATADPPFGDLLPSPHQLSMTGPKAVERKAVVMSKTDGTGVGGEIESSEGAAHLTVFQWHGDTFDLPAGAVQLARSAQCEIQAFRYGERAFGLQFHMEVTSEIIANWLCQSDNCGELAGLDYIDPAAIRRETPQKLPQMAAVGRRVFDRFASLCRPSSPSRLLGERPGER